jgi:hypothetical protein
LAVDESCSFFINGRLVKVENDVPLMGWPYGLA